jgi:hypothetical protein
MGDLGTWKVPAYSPNNKTVGHHSDLSNRLDIHFIFLTTLAVDGKSVKDSQAGSIPTFGWVNWMD